MPDYFIAEPACQQDAPGISSVLGRSYTQLLAEDYDADTLHQALPYMTEARPELLMSGTYFVVRDHTRRIVGAGGWSDFSPARGLGAADEAHIRHLAVDPCALKQGIGRTLMEESFISAQSFGVSALHCMSTRTAEPFYHSLGFERLHEIEISFAPGIHFPSVLMRKRLN